MRFTPVSRTMVDLGHYLIEELEVTQVPAHLQNYHRL